MTVVATGVVRVIFQLLQLAAEVEPEVTGVPEAKVGVVLTLQKLAELVQTEALAVVVVAQITVIQARRVAVALDFSAKVATAQLAQLVAQAHLLSHLLVAVGARAERMAPMAKEHQTCLQTQLLAAATVELTAALVVVTAVD